jgi:hypothetical protein
MDISGYEKNSSKPSKLQKYIVLTSSVGIPGREASREVLTVDAFLRRLEAREPTFLAAASGDFGTIAASCEGGSLTTGASVTGAVVANFFGSSLSLKKKQKVKYCVQVDRKKSI